MQSLCHALHILMSVYVCVLDEKGRKGAQPHGAAVSTGHHQREQGMHLQKSFWRLLVISHHHNDHAVQPCADLLHDQWSTMGGSLHLLHPGSTKTGHGHSGTPLKTFYLFIFIQTAHTWLDVAFFLVLPGVKYPLIPLVTQVKDSDSVQTLGRLNLPLSRLLTSANMTLDQWFQLDSAGPASRIYIKTVLRVFCTYWRWHWDPMCSAIGRWTIIVVII